MLKRFGSIPPIAQSTAVLRRLGSRPRWLSLSLGLGAVLTACSTQPLSQAVGTLMPRSDEPAREDIASREFNFPMDSCGDRSAEVSNSWYPVFVDGGSIDEIRQTYCKDAVSTMRNGKATVQVASFTSYDKALRFAQIVGGNVDAVAQTDRPPVESTPQAAPSPSPNGSLVGLSTALTARDPDAAINIRERATVESPVLQTSQTGSPVQVVDRTTGDDGYTWYQVKLDATTTGWVRSDFVSGANLAAGTTGSNSGPIAPASPAPTIGPAAPANSGTTADSATAASPVAPNAPIAPAANGKTAVLLGSGDAPINVRDSASTQSVVRYLGYAGDRVEIARSREGEDGMTWYEVKFESGTIGWVREDLVNLQEGL